MGKTRNRPFSITGSTACWIALACLVVPMFASYFFDDMFSTLSQIFQHPEMLQLGWDSADYGFYAGGYSFLCVCGGLVVCGVLLDVFGVRTVGSVFVGLMILGAGLVLFAITSGMSPEVSLTTAYIGCMIFGLGSEIAGVAVTRSIAKWFKGRNVALAMGLQLAIARLGTAAAFIISPILVAEKPYGEMYSLMDTARPAIFGLALLLAGGILWGVFVALDGRFDKASGTVNAKGEVKDEDKFRFRDIIDVLTNPRFLMIAFLCVFFYCCIISFKKFGTAIVIPRFGMDVDLDDHGGGTGPCIPSDNGFCPSGDSILRISRHFPAWYRILSRTVGDVAFRTKDNPGEEPWHRLFPHLLDTKHGNAACPYIRRKDFQGHRH